MEENTIPQPQQTQIQIQPESVQQSEPVEQRQFHFTTEGMPSVIAKKVSGLVDILNKDVVDAEILKKYLAEGIPDEAPIIRQYCWKIILGYLPEEKSKWNAVIQKQTNTYQSLIKMFLPDEKFPEYPYLLKRGHPRFQQLENDYLLWEQIEKDTSRTHAQFSFFAMQSKQIMLPYLTSARRQKFKLINGEDQAPYKEFIANKQKQKKTYRYDYMTRILYIYAKLNPKIQYVQGMNQILAPIFYMVNVTKSALAIEQSSCFFMFNNAICDIIQLHIKDFDKSKNGIHGKLGEVNDMLMVIEPTIWKRMEELKIDPFFYCFRWVTLLYAQDFPLFDTLRIWQSIFSSDNRMQYIKFFAIAIIISCKQFICEHEFTVVLEHLQDIKDHIVIRDCIAITNDLVQEYQYEDFSHLASKGKKKVEKQMQRQRQKRQKQERRQDEKKKKIQKKVSEGSEGSEKQQVNMSQKVQKKVGGFFKKMGNMVDKFLN